MVIFKYDATFLLLYENELDLITRKVTIALSFPGRFTDKYNFVAVTCPPPRTIMKNLYLNSLLAGNANHK